MSLDVYLIGKSTIKECTCSCCGNVHSYESAETLYSANITHNLGRMADAVGIYELLWRPEEVGVTHAHQLIEPLRAGIARLEAEREYCEQFNSPNGWGTYDNFVPWVVRYMHACEAHPDATVEVSR